MNIKDPKFKIGDMIYHITPESSKGIVLDCNYSLLHKQWSYNDSCGSRDNDYDYYEHELSTEKTII